MINFIYKVDLDWLPSLEVKVVEIYNHILSDSSFSDLSITVVYGDDDWLLDINKRFLNHDYYTDIITFDYSEAPVLSGELCVSINTVLSNASLYNVSRETELMRVLIHGVLHLCGFNDKTEEESSIMREKEDYYLAKLSI